VLIPLTAISIKVKNGRVISVLFEERKKETEPEAVRSQFFGSIANTGWFCSWYFSHVDALSCYQCTAILPIILLACNQSVRFYC